MRSPIRIAVTYLQNRKRWEDICTHCGQCCFKRSYDDDGRIQVDLEHPCPYLDPDTRLCTVYEERFAVCDRCHPMTLRQAAFADHLPETCAYRRLFDR